MKNNNVVKNDKKFNLNRPITGVIQNDRIWEQWYDPKKMNENLPKMNQADYEEMCNKDYPNDVILNNRGLKRITNSEFIAMRNKFIRSLKAMGIGKGDKVVSIALSTPELIAFKYACAYVGAITAHFNFMEDKDKMYKHIKLLNPSLIMFLDILEPNICEVLNSEEFNNIKKLRLPVSASTPALNDEKFKTALFTLNNKLQNKSVKGAISLGKFVSYGQYYNGPMESVYEDHLPSNIALSSGTTGESKAILLSHDANNALAKQHEIADLGLKRGEKNLALVPPFLAFWDADIIGMAMSLGLENILEMDLSYESVPKYLAKHKPNYGIWSQYLWDSVLYDKNKDEYIGNLKKVVIGGERPDINQVNRFKSETGITQEAGFGASEMDSCFSVAHPNCNMIGSSGLPLPFNNVMIKDRSFNDLSYNEPGRIWVTGPAMMNCYYNNPQMTDSVIYTDKNGVKWYNDSIGTSPTRTIAGLNAFDKKIVLIAGGYDKKLDYKPIAKSIIDKVSDLILMGATADKIQTAVEEQLKVNGVDDNNHALPIYRCNTLEEAVNKAYEVANSNEIVLFSPASASFDMYKNFMERGEKFKELVRNIEE